MQQDTDYKTLRVLDKTAILGDRTHELPNGKGGYERTTFKPGEYLELPPHAATILIGNDAFVVETPDGIVLRPVTETVGSGPNESQITLRTDQVIASLNELTKEALYARAKNLGVGDSLHPLKTPREELLSAVLRARAARPEVVKAAKGAKATKAPADAPAVPDAPGSAAVVHEDDPYA